MKWRKSCLYYESIWFWSVHTFLKFQKCNSYKFLMFSYLRTSFTSSLTWITTYIRNTTLEVISWWAVKLSKSNYLYTLRVIFFKALCYLFMPRVVVPLETLNWVTNTQTDTHRKRIFNPGTINSCTFSYWQHQM